MGAGDGSASESPGARQRDSLQATLDFDDKAMSELSSAHAVHQSQDPTPGPATKNQDESTSNKNEIALLSRAVSNVDLIQQKQDNPQRKASVPRPPLQSTATTAVSRTDIHTQSHQDGTRETFAVAPNTSPSTKSLQGFGNQKKQRGVIGAEREDTASLRSYVPASETGDAESLIGDVLNVGGNNQLWKLFINSAGESEESGEAKSESEEEDATFCHEFDDIGDGDQSEPEEQHQISQWRSKRKHFLILSSAGKPIYSRHGNDNIVSSTMGTIQTIISFFEGADNELKGFVTANTRFVVMSQGPLYLVAISRLQESDTQLRAQLEALYMQILSTLTLPTLKILFTNRPSTDLRRPLKGTEVLLSSLADAFTRGSPSALLSALECLKMRKSHRKTIDEALLKTRSDNLLYGLVVAGGRLVSVIRPRKHSLHAGDLQLIFNMLFEADGIKSGGGENWIPLCLPGFNPNGYLYMYVSFLPIPTAEIEDGNILNTADSESNDAIAILLVSANKESFFEMRKMRDDLVAELGTTKSVAAIKSALDLGRPLTTDIMPGTVLYHFLYRSRPHVQYVMSAYEPRYKDVLARRRLLSTYHKLQASVHAKNAHLSVKHCVSRNHISLAWITPSFELYCVAAPHASRSALAQSANKIVQWARREEERLFIVGGGVF